MSKTREALELVRMYIIGKALPNKEQVLKAIDDALAEPEQEPVYHLKQYGTVSKEQMDRYIATGSIDGTSPQPREWTELVELQRY